MNIYAEITKLDEEQRMVYGYASTEALDSQGEKVAKSAIEEALPEYMKFANIREMHTASAVGKAHEATIDDKGLFIGAKVVDENAWQKVKEGVYNGFSIGGKRISKINETITKMKLTEISLVDRPANPEAVFSFYKGEDMGEFEQPTDGQEVEKSDSVDDVEKSEVGGEVVKTESNLDILKGFLGEEVWDARTALEALSAIMSLLRSELSEDEKMPEQISALKQAVEALKAFIVSEIKEDNSQKSEEPEMTKGEEDGDVAKTEEIDADIEKAGASISASNKSKLQSIIDICKGMMGEVTEKSEEDGDITKSDDMAKAEEISMLKCDLEKANATIEKMTKEIEELKEQPEAPKGVLKAISKGDDYGSEKSDEAVDIIKDDHGNVNEVASLIKQAQKMGYIQKN